MDIKVSLTAFLLHFSVLGVLSKCPTDGIQGSEACFNRLFHSAFTCPSSNSSVHSKLTIPSNQTLQNELVNVTINVTDYNTSYAPYAHLLCMTKYFFIFPSIYYLGCIESSQPVVNLTVNWTTSDDVTVYLFTNHTNDSTNNYDCAYQEIYIQGDYPLNVNMTLSQYNLTQHQNMFQMGTINITVDASNVLSPSNGSYNYYDYGGSGVDPLDTTLLYQYRFFFFQNNSLISTVANKSNESSFLVSEMFEAEKNYSVLVEVICTNITNETTTLYYGETNTTFVVYEPVNNTNMKFKNNAGSNVSVEVMASGSVPINVTWNVQHIGNKSNDTFSCSVNNITLHALPKNLHNGTFNCTFTKPGTYKFDVVFSNSVSNKSDIFTFTVRGPSNKTTVVTTSTTIVIVVLLIVAVVCCIVFVSGYISYHKLKNRNTETANFTFIDLQRPSRLQRLKISAVNIKDKIAKRNQRKLGLVQPKDGDMSDVDSFYGSLTHFSGHESL